MCSSVLAIFKTGRHAGEKGLKNYCRDIRYCMKFILKQQYLWNLYRKSKIREYISQMCVIFNNLFKLKILQLPILTNVGKYSIDYYCAHWILFNVIVLIYSFRDQDIPNYYELYVLLAWSAIVLPSYSYWHE